MKYWNRDKKIRQALWTKVQITGVDYHKEKFLWCQRHESAGKFYRYYGSSIWWFENKEDALIFALRWP